MATEFTKSISQVLKRAGKSFGTYPSAIASALVFTLVTIIRIHLDWEAEEAYNFLFNCLQLSLALGALFSLTIIAAARSRINTKGSFLAANLMGVGFIIATFLLLYYFGGTDKYLGVTTALNLKNLSLARVFIAMFVSILAFILITGYPSHVSDFSKSFFMFHKVFFIALIYGTVMYLGGSGVAASVKALLYNDMSTKIFAYIATISGFLAYTIFIGYFPDFSKGQMDERREMAQTQPRFIEVLLEYIMVPVALALTIVLLLWSVKTIITDGDVAFIQLSSIAVSYAGLGLWLQIMVTHSQSGSAKFYRRVYPLAALIILAFEAGALISEVRQWGIKTAEYYFIIIWLVSVASMILLITKKKKSHTIIVVLICVMSIISVLPVVGYGDLPVAIQSKRLEKILTDQGMLKDGEIIAAATEPDRLVRETITDSVDYLVRTENSKLPIWLKYKLNEPMAFKEQFGFEQAWPRNDYGGMPPEYSRTDIFLPLIPLNIKGYEWGVNIRDKGGLSSPITVLEGTRGNYSIYWNEDREDTIPIIKIELDDEILVEQDMSNHLEKILAKYPLGNVPIFEGTVEDMTFVIETPEIKVLLVIGNIVIDKNVESGDIQYWLEPRMLYITEK